MRFRTGSGRLLLLAIGCTAFTMGLHGQAASSNSPSNHQTDTNNTHLLAFDVVSIKPMRGDQMHSSMKIVPDGVSVVGVPLSLLFPQIFGVSGYRILDQPAWSKSDKYEIEAKVDPTDVSAFTNLDAARRWAMLLPVLENRFGLKFHHETKKLEVYTLVLAKGGLKMKESTPATPGGKLIPRAIYRTWEKGMGVEGHGLRTTAIANIISQQIGGTVVDETNLEGVYDFSLQWIPDMGVGRMISESTSDQPSNNGSRESDASGPSIFTALQEQLGLKLVAHKEAVDVIVIDHLDRPSEN